MEKNDPAAAYRKMTREEFDAIVTGELTHHVAWLESELETAIENYFSVPANNREIFRRLVLQREGMTVQNKIELVHSIIREGKFDDEYRKAWKTVLARIEEIKRIRNAMAHGKDNGGTGLEMRIGYVNRAGKEIEIEVNPDLHVKRLADAERLMTMVKTLAAQIRQAT
jgi:hypothetical protein